MFGSNGTWKYEAWFIRIGGLCVIIDVNFDLSR